MSAVEAVHHSMERVVPEPGEDREDLARRMFYLQMEIYSAHAMTTLYGPNDFEFLADDVRASWLKKADRKLADGD